MLLWGSTLRKVTGPLEPGAGRSSPAPSPLLSTPRALSRGQVRTQIKGQAALSPFKHAVTLGKFRGSGPLFSNL